MSARIYGDTLVLLTDGGACGQSSRLGLAAYTAPTAVLSASPRTLFAFVPAKEELLEEYTKFPAASQNYALRVMPKSGPAVAIGVGSRLNATVATFRVYPLKTDEHAPTELKQSTAVAGNPFFRCSSITGARAAALFISQNKQKCKIPVL
jgi:hypothetical protein